MCHDTVKLDYLYSDVQIEIDAGIANLIKLIWKHGFRTSGSCQEHVTGFAWIMFDCINDAREFIRLIHNQLILKYGDLWWMGNSEDALGPRALGMHNSSTSTPAWSFNFPLCGGGISALIPLSDVSKVESLLSERPTPFYN